MLPEGCASAAPDPAASLVEDGRVRLVGKPGRLDLIQRAVRLERRDRLVDARGQRAALGEDETEVTAAACGGRELADDGAVRDLHGRHVEGRRQVDDDAVDLMRLEGVDR